MTTKNYASIVEILTLILETALQMIKYVDHVAKRNHFARVRRSRNQTQPSHPMPYSRDQVVCT